MTQHWADDQFAAADAAGFAQLAAEPRTMAVRYVVDGGRVEVELSNSSAFAFPARLVEGLANLEDDRVTGVSIIGSGFGIEWDALDIEVTVAGLVVGVFGTERYMAAPGRRAGRTHTAAKAKASRLNGARGGRPRKAFVG